MSDIGGSTGFSYLDAGGGELQGTLNGSIGPIQAQVVMGVDSTSKGGAPTFFLDVKPGDPNTPQNASDFSTFVTVPNVMASGSVSGQTSIGDLSTVTIAGTATVNIASATLAFQGDTSSSTKLHITSATQSVNVSGTLDGSVALSSPHQCRDPAAAGTRVVRDV